MNNYYCNDMWCKIGVYKEVLHHYKVRAVIKRKPEDFLVCELLGAHVKNLFTKNKGFPLLLVMKADLDILKAKGLLKGFWDVR